MKNWPRIWTGKSQKRNLRRLVKHTKGIQQGNGRNKNNNQGSLITSQIGKNFKSNNIKFIKDQRYGNLHAFYYCNYPLRNDVIQKSQRSMAGTVAPRTHSPDIQTSGPRGHLEAVKGIHWGTGGCGLLAAMRSRLPQVTTQTYGLWNVNVQSSESNLSLDNHFKVQIQFYIYTLYNSHSYA